VGVDSIGRQFTDSHEIRPQKVGRLFDMERHSLRVIRKGCPFGFHISIHERDHVSHHPGGGARKGMFPHKPIVFLFQTWFEVTASGSVEAAFSLINPLNQVILYLSGRTFYSFEFLDRIGVRINFPTISTTVRAVIDVHQKLLSLFGYIALCL
jgi:hypothetical protein